MDFTLANLIEKSVKCLSELEGVLAIALVGSVARGEADEWSDADFVIIIKDSFKAEAMQAEWVKDIDEHTILFRQFGYEVRVLYHDFYDVDYIFFSENQSIGEVDSELADMLSNGYRIVYDPKGILANITLAGETSENVDFEELSDDFWFHVMWAAKKIARGELWYAYYWTNRGLQSQLLEMARGDIKNPVRRQRFVDQEVDDSTLDIITSTFAVYDTAEIIAGLRKCMSAYWKLQQMYYPTYSKQMQDKYESVQAKAMTILGSIEI